MKQTVFIAADHGGFEVKQQLIEYIAKEFPKLEIEDGGAHSSESVDYPSFAHWAGEKVAQNGARAILICGSGIGMSIAANKIKGARAALAWNETSARLSRQHNDANILCLGARLIGIEVIKDIVRVWLGTDFEGGRHQRRVSAIEK